MKDGVGENSGGFLTRGMGDWEPVACEKGSRYSWGLARVHVNGTVVVKSYKLFNFLSRFSFSSFLTENSFLNDKNAPYSPFCPPLLSLIHGLIYDTLNVCMYIYI